jgi:ribose transport system permease protein
MAMIGDALRISRLALVAAVDRFAIWIVLLALLALATTLSDAFLRPAYLGNVVRRLAPVGTAAVGATFVMILGGIDLSVGAVISLAVVICAV